MKLSGLEFHHIGVACQNIEREIGAYSLLGYTVEGESFSDPAQQIRGLFLSGPGPRLELVAPLTQESRVLSNVLTRGVKMYHLAYLTDDINATIDLACAERAKLVVSPVPATAFGGRCIAFLFLPNMMLIELIEK
jgi:methylmalonyl-CoA/ethylmalonyl-CoA epimerase